MKSEKSTKRHYSYKIAFLGILSALCITFSFIEGLIPQLPFMPPGAKLGLSNIIVMYTAVIFSLPSSLCICLVKSAFVLITRGLTASVMSLSGGITSAIVMYFVSRRLKKLGYIGMGVAGAVTHNTFQLIAAMLITSTYQLVYYYPALILFAVAAGMLTGTVFGVTLPVFEKITDKSAKSALRRD